MPAAQPAPISVPDRFSPEKGESWRIVCDPESGILRLEHAPSPEEMPRHYRHAGYSPHLQEASGPGERLYLAASSLLLRRRARLVAETLPRPSRSRILEVGCARGSLLDRLATRYGIPRGNLVGVEPDPASAAYARERFGLTLHQSLDTLPDGAGPFDAIVLWHALEHLHDLHGSLDTMARLLAPGGRLVVALPNPSGSDARHYGADWVAWDAPRHLWHFPPGTLERMLEPYGLRRTAIRQWAPDALFNAFMSEELQSKRSEKRMHAGRKALALLKGALFALGGMLETEQAAGIVRVFERIGRDPSA